MIKLMQKTLAVVLLSMGTMGVQATPMTWNLNGVTFDDGGTAVGSFVFDAQTATYSGVDITTSAGNSSSGNAYGTQDVSSTLFGGSSASTLSLDDVASNSFLLLNFLAPLTDAGGDIQIDGQASFEGFRPIFLRGECSGPFCGQNVIARVITAGRISTAEPDPVPAPFTLGLFSLGLVGLGFSRRRKA